MKKKTIENGNGISIWATQAGIVGFELGFEKNNFLGNGIRTPPPPSPPSCLSKSFTLWSTGQPQTVKVEPLYWTYRVITGNHLSILSLATEVKHVISYKRSIFPWYAFRCDLYSCCILLQRLSLHFFFFWWTDPRGVVATFQHLLQLRVFPLQVLVFLHQIDSFATLPLSFLLISALAMTRWGLNLHSLSSMGLVKVVMLFWTKIVTSAFVSTLFTSPQPQGRFGSVIVMRK